MLKKLAYSAPALLLAYATVGAPGASAAQHRFGADAAAEITAQHDDPAFSVARVHSPESYDLSKYALPAGDQGPVGACVSWATGYTATGLLMRKQGIPGAPMAPMYLYAQLARGHQRGTSSADNLTIEKKQGIDTKADYHQGDIDYTTQPTPAERANAARYKVSGYHYIKRDANAENGVKDAISHGHPVVIVTYIHQDFDYLAGADATDYGYAPDSAEPVVGTHAVTIIGYTKQGVRIENSWGAGWGDRGFANVSWDFVRSPDVKGLTVVEDLLT